MTPPQQLDNSVQAAPHTLSPPRQIGMADDVVRTSVLDLTHGVNWDLPPVSGGANSGFNALTTSSARTMGIQGW